MSLDHPHHTSAAGPVADGTDDGHEHDLEPDHHGGGGGLNAMAASATLHCLTGCAIGEIAGLVIGTAAGIGTAGTIVVSVALAFAFGYALSSVPLLRAGLPLAAALGVVLAADTVSIATMEVVDNLVMALIPGAMDAGLINVTFWISMALALAVAFAAAYPVNRRLLQRGKGHALTHEYHHGSGPAPTGWRRRLPDLPTALLVAGISAFLGGGLIVAVADHYGWGGSAVSTVTNVAARADATAHDPADVSFAQQMVDHHEQALEMTRLVDSRSSSPAVEALAAQISAAQGPEIEQMQGWLRDWGARTDGAASGSTGGSTGGSDDEMPGMMSSADMTRLSRLSGSGFDRMWLTLMIQHHQGAVTMARDELTHGENSQALALASSIQITQTAQIEQMRDLVRQIPVD